MAALLDQVIDEFGLVVCGWSADWDAGLRSAIERSPNRRFTMFWCVRGVPTTAANDLIKLRGASVIYVKDADSFSRATAEKVLALKNLSREHPMSAKIAVEIVKRYLPNSSTEINLHDLVMNETDNVYRKCTKPFFNSSVTAGICRPSS